MASPLSGSLATALYKGMRGLFLDATLVRQAVPVSPVPFGTVAWGSFPWNGTFDVFDPPANVLGSASYACKAIVETYRDRYRSEGLVDQNDRKVLILANSLSVTPVRNDRITISGVTFDVQEVMTDPATAIWECRGRMG